MRLRTLARRLPGSRQRGGNPDITHGVHYDYRRVVPGSLFVAVRDLWEDGHAFIPHALAAGAVAVVAETQPTHTAPWLTVPDGAQALAEAAASFHGHPSQRGLQVLAVTGTNGKTTVAWLLYQILLAAGRVPGLVGTVEQRFGDVVRETQFTTPLSVDLQALMAEMRAAGCTHVALEASSHALTTHRLTGTRVAVGGFTNLSRDHLDFHGGLDAYRAAKALLFSQFARAGCFHVDDAVGAELSSAFSGPQLTVGTRAADVTAHGVLSDLAGTHCVLRAAGAEHTLSLPLVGAFNLENGLVALGMARLAGVSMRRSVAALSTAKAAPGRLEPVPGKGPTVLVDYAHTPDALHRVLQTLRRLSRGRLVCVFGAGGDRDRGKRPLMGAAVAGLADEAFVTSDNPRTEDPSQIVADILPGLSGAYTVEIDRAKAIRLAMESCGPDDVVLIAGKGHETYQVLGSRRLPFDDRAVARSCR
jgi:UDP-N-acetylmuramoyl-L-alanyl-D-glutamate--2,6-diaminopimelate ligase